MSAQSRHLPDRPNLRYLRIEAKRRLAAGEFNTLHEARLAIAREHGLSSWTALKELIEASGPTSHALAQVRRLLGMFAVGRVINPLLARSQLVGGMIMGLSMALHEEACAIPPRDAISTPTSPATTSPHTPTYPTSKPTMNPAIRQGQRRGRNRHRGHRRRDRERRLARHRPPPANPAHPPRPRTRRRAPDREPPATAGTRSAAVAARAQHLTRRHTCCAKSGPSSTPTVRRAGPLCTSTGTRKASGPKPADVRRAFKASITPG